MSRSKRTRACDFTSKVRREINERDNHSCIVCGSSYLVGIAHLVSRAKGGLGVKENGVCLCGRCHFIADQGYNLSERLKINERMRNYLEELYPECTDEQRIYRKYDGAFDCVALQTTA